MAIIDAKCFGHSRGCCSLARMVCYYVTNCRRLLEAETELLCCFVFSRAYAASVNKEKILETLEESQPRLSKAIVDSAPFPLQQGHSKTAPLRTPLSSSEKKARLR